MSLVRKTAIQWMAGGSLSVLAAWAAGAIFCDSPGQLAWDAARGIVRRADDVSVQFRSEGWGLSRFGRLGVSAVPDIGKVSRPVVILWGDSHMEALQVDDSEKPAAQLDKLMGGCAAEPRAIAVALSGEMMADYVVKIPVYEKVVSCRGHYIVISDLEEALPDQPGASYAKFRSTPVLAIEHSSPGVVSQARTRIQKLLRNAHLEFVVPLHRGLAADFSGRSFLARLRFRPGPTPDMPTVPVDPVPPTVQAEAWRFLLGRLAAQTTNPVTVVYAPRWPRIAGGRVERADPSCPPLATFAQSCRGAGVGWIDLTAAFLDYWDATRRFPRGFSNSRPGEGHFNAEGHGLIAAAVHADLVRRGHALHAD